MVYKTLLLLSASKNSILDSLIVTPASKSTLQESWAYNADD
jgi:hypothetical protein